jgi:hypothetical protein
MPNIHEEMQGRVRGLLILVADQLPERTASLVEELIDHNESGVALEIMSDILVESGGALSAEAFEIAVSAAETMRLDRHCIDQLRSLLKA